MLSWARCLKCIDAICIAILVSARYGASPASSSATCRTLVDMSPRRRSLPSILSMHPRSPSTTQSAFACATNSHLLSASRDEISPYLIENVPPKPQQVSDSVISLSVSPGILASSLRGCCFDAHFAQTGTRVVVGDGADEFAGHRLQLEDVDQKSGELPRLGAQRACASKHHRSSRKRSA